MYVEDTIVAIATPAGPGGIGIVRVSGAASERIANRVFSSPRGPLVWASHHLYHGRVLAADGQPLDEALAVLMRRPHSYTGEDVLELHCHGSPLVLRRAVDVVVTLGAREATPGEFTKRAFLNGKLDLAQAEAVIDLVRARTPSAADQATAQLLGGLSRRLAEVRERLIRIKAHLEVQIDFSDEDVDLDAALPLSEVDAAAEEVASLLHGYAQGRLVREGLRMAIVGAPNAGKSTLLNALLGEERAIVTPVAGTTRDVIEEAADFRGVPVVLSDTAGLREASGEVERIGVARALAQAHEADVVALVIDSSLPPTAMPAEIEGLCTLAVLNKSDLPCAWSAADVAGLARRYPVVRISARRRSGLDDLRAAVLSCAGATRGNGLPVLTRARQFASMRACRDSLGRAGAALRGAAAPELVAVDVQGALDAIAAVTGAVTSEDVLDLIFRDFCIGK